jgi:hypothetical protein
METRSGGWLHAQVNDRFLVGRDLSNNLLLCRLLWLIRWPNF